MLLLEKGPQPLDPTTHIPMQELPRYGGDNVDFIDVDGTLSNTEIVVNRIGYAGEKFGITSELVAAERALWKAREETLDPYAYIRRRLSPGDFEEWCDRYRHAAHIDTMFPDGRDLLRREKAQPNTPHLAATYSTSAPWQAKKLWSGDFRGFALIMDHINKGTELARLENPRTKHYDIVGLSEANKPVLLYEALRSRLIDDREPYLYDTPPSCDPVYVDRHGKGLEWKSGKLAAHTRTISNLGELGISKNIEPLNGIARRLATPPQVAAWVPLRLFVGHQG
jgi:hypothetical protein